MGTITIDAKTPKGAASQVAKALKKLCPDANPLVRSMTNTYKGLTKKDNAKWVDWHVVAEDSTPYEWAMAAPGGDDIFREEYGAEIMEANPDHKWVPSFEFTTFTPECENGFTLVFSPNNKTIEKKEKSVPKNQEESLPKKVNPVLEASSIEDKLAATVTGYTDAEISAAEIVKATLIQLASKETDKEDKLKNLGTFQVTVRIAETGSKKGTSAKDNDVLGHYCPAGTKNGEVKVGDMDGRDLVINIWKLYDMTAEDFFEVCAHEAIHLYSDLIATSSKERDCNKGGGHRAFSTNGDFSFEGLNNQLGWLELVEIGSPYKFTTQIGKEGQKVCKAMGITAPKMGKIPAKKKAAPKRINVMCNGCGYKVMVPTGRYYDGLVDMYCNIHSVNMEKVD